VESTHLNYGNVVAYQRIVPKSDSEVSLELIHTFQECCVATEVGARDIIPRRRVRLVSNRALCVLRCR